MYICNRCLIATCTGVEYVRFLNFQSRNYPSNVKGINYATSIVQVSTL